MTRQRRGGGRVTPPSSSGRPAAAGPGSTGGRRRVAQGGPGAPSPAPQVGRRPSPPLLLFAVALSWIAAAAYLWLVLSASWKVIPVIVALGIGALFMRGAVLTVVRHEERAGR